MSYSRHNNENKIRVTSYENIHDAFAEIERDKR